MSIGETLANELAHEAITTRRHLERVPEDKFGWKPHERSMALGALASHLANIPEWAGVTMNTTFLDLDTGQYRPLEATTRAELLAAFDKFVAASKDILAAKPDEEYMVPWSMKFGGKVAFSMPRIAVLRSMILNHSVHHRAQLGVYLRLLGVDVPSTYGPSADEQPAR